MGEEVLKKCPFCGGEAEIVRIEEKLKSYLRNNTSGNLDKLYAWFFVRCTNMECRCQTENYYTLVKISEEGVIVVERNGAELAIDAWNRRAGEDNAELD